MNQEYICLIRYLIANNIIKVDNIFGINVGFLPLYNIDIGSVDKGDKDAIIILDVFIIL